MAISVDQVYRTVLLIMNKEQRGYLTPDDFNKIGTQVQLEMFNEYFEELNQQTRVPQNENEYADRIKNLEEKLAPFKTSPTTAVYNSDYFNLPTTSSPVAQETIQTVVNQSAYAFTTLQASQVSDGVTFVYFDGVLQSEGPSGSYQITGGGSVLTLNSIPSTVFEILVVLYQDDFYKIGTVIYKDEKEVELIERNDFLRINTSPLTKPTISFPVYIFENNKLYVKPTSITSDIKVSYLKKPANVNWGFTSSGNGYVYNPSTSVDFLLQPTEQTSVTTRVLLYAGVVVRNPQLIQIAASQIQSEKVNEKS
jgi:hypothetical protein